MWRPIGTAEPSGEITHDERPRCEHVGRALHVQQHVRLAVGFDHLVCGQHELVGGVERHLGQPRMAGAQLVDVQPTLLCEHHQGSLGRVADELPKTPLPSASRTTASLQSAIGTSAAPTAIGSSPGTCSMRPSGE